MATKSSCCMTRIAGCNLRSEQDINMTFTNARIVSLVLVAIMASAVSGRQLTVECRKDTWTNEFLCATDPASVTVDVTSGMTGHVSCTMSCTLDLQCLHFNYHLSANNCQLYYYTPTNFIVDSDCEHYETPGLVETATTVTPTLPVNPWIVIQSRFSGSYLTDQNWAAYRDGFGDVTSSDFWLGLAEVYELTSVPTATYRLRFEIQASANNQWYYAEYATFYIDSETDDYTLHVTGYTGDAWDGLNVNYNNRGIHNGRKFTTKDEDNDNYNGSPSSGNCALMFNGGWWYDKCHQVNLNGSFKWKPLKNEPTIGLSTDALSASIMKIQLL